MLFKLSNLNSNLALTLGYVNPALNNSAQEVNFRSCIIMKIHDESLMGPVYSLTGYCPVLRELLRLCGYNFIKVK